MKILLWMNEFALVITAVAVTVSAAIHIWITRYIRLRIPDKTTRKEFYKENEIHRLKGQVISPLLAISGIAWFKFGEPWKLFDFLSKILPVVIAIVICVLAALLLRAHMARVNEDLQIAKNREQIRKRLDEAKQKEERAATALASAAPDVDSASDTAQTSSHSEK